MEKVEIAIRVLSCTYAIGVIVLVVRLQSQSISMILSLQSCDLYCCSSRLACVDTIMLVTIYFLVFTCPW